MMRFDRSHMAIAFVLAMGGAVVAAPRLDQPSVPDVLAAFARIADAGHPLGAWGGPQMPFPFYSLNLEHDFGDNHFQGVQRLRAGPYLVVSGSNIGRDGNMTRWGLPVPAGWETLPPAHGDLIVLRLGDRPMPGPLGSNIDAAGLPADSARVVARVPIRLPLPSGTTLWHPAIELWPRP